jgi:hypothetical protein
MISLDFNAEMCSLLLFIVVLFSIAVDVICCWFSTYT